MGSVPRVILGPKRPGPVGGSAFCQFVRGRQLSIELRVEGLRLRLRLRLHFDLGLYPGPGTRGIDLPVSKVGSGKKRVKGLVTSNYTTLL